MVNLLTYMVTIRKHQVKDHVDPIDIERVMLILLQEHEIEVYDCAYEIDPRYHQLHLHGLCKASASFTWITSINGFRIYWDKIYKVDLPKVTRYIHKNYDQCHEVVNAYSEYAF